MLITENIFKNDPDDDNKFNKPVTQYSLRESITAFMCIGIGAFFTKFIIFSKGSANISYTVFFILLILTSLFFFKNTVKIRGVMSYIQLAVLVAYSLNFCIGTNMIIKGLDIVFLTVAFAFYMYNISYNKKFIEIYIFFDIIKSTIVIPIANLGKCVFVIINIIRKNKKSKNIKMIFIGLLMAVPLVIIVCPLLFEADKMMKDFFINGFNKINNYYLVYAFKGAISFFMGSMFFAIIYGNKKISEYEKMDQQISEESKSSIINSAAKIPGTVLYAMVTPVCLLYIMFFFSQIKYFLSAFSGALPESFSYAQYARKGFFELCVVAIINLVIIILINLLCQKANEQKPRLMKIYTIIISVFTEIMIATVLSKMIMYIFNYGFTQLRLYTSWFMIMLAVMFVLIIIKQFAKKLRLSSAIVFTFIIMFSILSFGRPEANIARWNIKLYENNITEDLDMHLLSYLSDEAIPYISEYAESDDKLSYNAKEILIHKAEDKDNKDWTSFNIYSYRAEKILKQYK